MPVAYPELAIRRSRSSADMGGVGFLRRVSEHLGISRRSGGGLSVPLTGFGVLPVQEAA